MRIIIVITSILIIIGGILLQLNKINSIPIIVIGALGLLLGIFNAMMTGLEKFMAVSISAATLILGVLPYFSELALPYPLIIIIVGVVGLFYGFTS